MVTDDGSIGAKGDLGEPGEPGEDGNPGGVGPKGRKGNIYKKYMYVSFYMTVCSALQLLGTI